MIDVWRWYHGERERESRRCEACGWMLRRGSAGEDKDLRVGRKGREGMEEDGGWKGERRIGWMARMVEVEVEVVVVVVVVEVVDDGNAVFSVTISEEGGGLRIASDVKKGAASKKSETKSETKSAML